MSASWVLWAAAPVAVAMLGVSFWAALAEKREWQRERAPQPGRGPGIVLPTLKGCAALLLLLTTGAVTVQGGPAWLAACLGAWLGFWCHGPTTWRGGATIRKTGGAPP